MTFSLKKCAIAAITLAASTNAFAPLSLPSQRTIAKPSVTSATDLSLSSTSFDLEHETQKIWKQEEPLPYFATDATPIRDNTMQSDSIDSTLKRVKRTAPMHKKTAAKGGKANKAHNEGVFSPLVLSLKKILGDEKLNEIRAKVISLHSDTIKSFVDTADTEFGKTVLERLFSIADKNKDGKLDKEEIAEALQMLGFTWLQDKQIDSIVKRGDIDSNGVIDFEEFLDEAPKTLRTNLVKLAKKNGGEMGLLV